MLYQWIEIFRCDAVMMGFTLTNVFIELQHPIQRIQLPIVHVRKGKPQVAQSWRSKGELLLKATIYLAQQRTGWSTQHMGLPVGKHGSVMAMGATGILKCL